MDEVDGMSAGDRGGVGALNALIKKSKVGELYIRDLVIFFTVELFRSPLYALRMTDKHRS